MQKMFLEMIARKQKEIILEQEKTKREQQKVEQHSHQGMIDLASTERMKQLTQSISRNDIDKSIRQPIKFAGRVS